MTLAVLRSLCLVVLWLDGSRGVGAVMRIGRAMSLYRLFRTSASSFSAWPCQLALCQIDCVGEGEVICPRGHHRQAERLGTLSTKQMVDRSKAGVIFIWIIVSLFFFFFFPFFFFSPSLSHSTPLREDSSCRGMLWMDGCHTR